MSAFQHVRTVELRITQIEGYNASLILQRQQDYNQKLKAEKQVTDIANQASLAVRKIIKIFRGALKVPPEDLWQFQGVLAPVFDLPIMATEDNLQFASAMSVKGTAYRALIRHERHRQELMQLNQELCERVRQAWEEHLDHILEPKSAPSMEPLRDVVPFDDKELDRIMGR